MAQTTFDISDWKAFERDMVRLGTHVPNIMETAGKAAGAKFDQLVREELPPPVRVQKQAPYWTDKQRRWWWGTMHRKAQGKSKALPGWKAVYRRVEGRKTLVISGHYKRTGTLVKSLTYEVVQGPNETLIKYGTNRKYAKYVLDQEDQATYHKGNWKTLNAFAVQYREQVVQAFAATAWREIDRYLGV